MAPPSYRALLVTAIGAAPCRSSSAAKRLATLRPAPGRRRSAGSSSSSSEPSTSPAITAPRAEALLGSAPRPLSRPKAVARSTPPGAAHEVEPAPRLSSPPPGSAPNPDEASPREMPNPLPESGAENWGAARETLPNAPPAMEELTPAVVPATTAVIAERYHADTPQQTHPPCETSISLPRAPAVVEAARRASSKRRGLRIVDRHHPDVDGRWTVALRRAQPSNCGYA